MNKKFKNITNLGNSLRSNKIAQLLEIGIVFFAAFIIIILGGSFVGNNPILRQGVVWFANIAMLCIIWFGLRSRNQGWTHLGLSKKNLNLRSFLLSFLVFIGAIFGFILGSIIMANIVGIPESADMSKYNYIQNNLPMLLGALLAVFIVSSFGEEVIYRGFLITRISEIGGNTDKWIKISVLISSIIFALIHFEWGLMGIVQTGFMGLALGISFLLVKRNLWVLILAHAYMDTILMLQMYLG